jgi:hypothetical protein
MSEKRLNKIDRKLLLIQEHYQGLPEAEIAIVEDLPPSERLA